MGLIKEFREFAIKGNVVDMAVGFIMGVGFTGVVKSFVDQVLMPPLGMLLNKVDFSSLKIVLKEGVDGQGEVSIAYGAFINTLISFTILAFVVFMIVKQINRLKRSAPAETAPPSTKECPFCASNIAIKAVRCPQCTSQLTT